MSNTNMETEDIRLTAYSHGAGCGCKIAPAVLSKILGDNIAPPDNEKLIVGNDTRDDAAVYDLDNGQGLISTTDFFMPIVDDAFDFGRIAAANALSDVYAMGGRPVLAISILGWPVNKLAPEVAGRVIEGARSICAEAGASLAGGHSIDSPEPIFGLAVNGLVDLNNLKRNSGAKAGDLLYLTKPLGVGILTTAEKKGLLLAEHKTTAPEIMTRLNTIGAKIATLPAVHALTDVTGFGLLGHLSEVCGGSGLSAELIFADVPQIPGLDFYLKQGAVPGGTNRNWDSYGTKIGPLEDDWRKVLADPQTSGGLLAAVDPAGQADFEAMLNDNGLGDFARPIGQMGVAGADGVLVRVR